MTRTLSVRCPKCDARPGRQCMGTRIPSSNTLGGGWGGPVTLSRSHTERVQHARAENTPVEPPQKPERDEAYSFFAFPDLNARIGLALDGDTLAVTLLSEGTSRSGAGEYKRRNPDRRKAFRRLIEDPLFRPHTTRGGKAANPAEPLWGSATLGSKCLEDLLQAFRQGGNYRFDCWVSVSHWTVASSQDRTVADYASILGLQPTQNRPVAVRWLGGAA